MTTAQLFKNYVEKIQESQEIADFFEKYEITPYVYKIIILYANGLCDKQVAAELGRTIPGVTMAKWRLKRKMKCESSNQMFYQLGKNNII